MTMRFLLLALLPAAVLLTACTERTEAPEEVLDQALVEDQTTVEKIDMHAHYRTLHPDLLPILEAWNLRPVLVNVASSGSIVEKWADMTALAEAHPDRFYLAATFDPFRFNEPDFVERTIEELRAAVDEGARMVKVWKNIGLELKDDEGNYVQIDHPRFQPIWDYLTEAGIPVIAHIAEPRAAWLPLDEQSPHYGYYSSHPEYHAYQHPEMPRWETIIAARDRWIERNPDLLIVGAHMGSMSHDVDEVARRLDAYPNLLVETAARMRDLTIQPSEKVRDFMIRYADRVLYGTDYHDGTVSGGSLERRLADDWAYLATPDSMTFGNPDSWHTRTKGLGLPRHVIERIYARNAERVLGLD